MKYFSYTIIAIVAVAVITGFFIVGSPQKERLRRFDEQRVTDLQSIQYQIVNYWQNKSTLPPDLAALNDSISGFAVPVDPQTGASYGYIATSPQTFQLCASFVSDSTPSRAGIQKTVPAAPVAYPGGVGTPIGQNWEHGAGKVCFDRTIDPDFYPSKSK